MNKIAICYDILEEMWAKSLAVVFMLCFIYK